MQQKTGGLLPTPLTLGPKQNRPGRFRVLASAVKRFRDFGFCLLPQLCTPPQTSNPERLPKLQPNTKHLQPEILNPKRLNTFNLRI